MKKLGLVVLVAIVGIAGYGYVQHVNTGAPPYVEEETTDEIEADPYAKWRNWKRPEGPARVGLQVGHWKSNELPEELASLRSNTGSSGGGKWEWEVNMKIAEETKKLLEEQGVVVELLPATVPPGYWADVFLAIHADGNLNKTLAGYKFAAPRRDLSGWADELVATLETEYGETTGLTLDPNVSRNMRGYYAFAWWRREHAVHPMTTAAIAETGFLSSPSDQRLLIGRPQIAAQGLAKALIKHLQDRGLLLLTDQ